MTTHTKGGYIAFRSRRYTPTKRELAARSRVAAAELEDQIKASMRCHA